MASFSQLFLFIASLVLIIMAMSMESTIAVSARSLPTEHITNTNHHLPTSTLAVRLQSNGSSECWESLIELKACTGEVIRFFLNGETYLGPNCCRAIQIIQHKCWPAMLGSLGFTPEESNILRGYCACEATIDHDDNVGSSSPPSPPSLPTLIALEADSRP